MKDEWQVGDRVRLNLGWQYSWVREGTIVGVNSWGLPVIKFDDGITNAWVPEALDPIKECPSVSAGGVVRRICMVGKDMWKIRVARSGVFSRRTAMLTLSRRVGQSFEIKVGDTTFRVMVVDTKGQKVKIGFDAPRDVVITRAELLQKKEERK